MLKARNLHKVIYRWILINCLSSFISSSFNAQPHNFNYVCDKILMSTNTLKVNANSKDVIITSYMYSIPVMRVFE